MDMMYASCDFKDDWVERKKALERPPSLKSVTWRFRHKNPADVNADLAEEPDVPHTEDESDTGQAAGPSSDN